MLTKLLECFGSFALAYASERDIDIASTFAVSNVADNVFFSDKYYFGNGLLAYRTSTEIHKLFGKKESPIINLTSFLAGIFATKFCNVDLVSDFKKYSLNSWNAYSEMVEALPESRAKITFLTGTYVIAQIGIEQLVSRYISGFFEERNGLLDRYQKGHQDKQQQYIDLIKYGLLKMFGTKVLSAFWDNFFSQKLIKGIANNIKKDTMNELFDNVVARELISNPELRGDLDNVVNNIQYNIANNIKGISTYFKNLYFFTRDFKDINDKAPGLNHSILLSNAMFNGLSKFLAFESFYDAKSLAEAQYRGVLDDIISNMKVIREKETQSDMKADLFKLFAVKEKLANEENLRNATRLSFWKLDGLSQQFLWSSLMYQMIMCDNKTRQDMYPLFFKTDSIYNLCEELSSVDNDNYNLTAIKKARQLIKILQELKNHNLEYSHKKSEDSEDSSLRINSLKISYDEQVILDIQKPMILTPGIYALVGPSGRGKSTFLETLKLGKEAIASVNGEVILPGSGSVLMFSQTDFIAGGNLSLLELLCHPIKISPENEMKITTNLKAFLESLKTDELDLSDTISRLVERFDERRYDWREVLSGGEKKLVQLCNFFVKASQEKTAAIFLDESLNGMDPKLTMKVMENIKQTFSGKIVLIITHQHEMQNNLFKQETSEDFFNTIIEFDSEGLVTH